MLKTRLAPFDPAFSPNARKHPRNAAPSSEAMSWPLRLALLSMVLAGISRTLVFAGMPRVLDFIHFPLAIAAFASLRFSELPRSARTACRWLGVLFVGILASTISAFGFDPVRSLAGWVLLSEPILIAIAVTGGVGQSRSSTHSIRLVMRAILTLAWLQAIVGLAQWATGARGDQVQGTFINMGAGAHVASAVLFVGVIVVVARFLFQDTEAHRWTVLLAVLAGLAFAVIADAKQVLVAAVPALGVLFAFSLTQPHTQYVPLSRRTVRRRTRRLAMAIIGVTLLSATYVFYPPLQRLGDSDYLGAGANSKIQTAGVVLSEMTDPPHRIIVGLGPAAGVSRFALLTQGGALKADSPLQLLGVEIAPVTNRIRQLTASDYLGSSSSVWGGFASLTGLVGDLGLIGLAAYVMAWISITRPMLRVRTYRSAAAVAALALAAVLGLLYLWWEEPGFMLLVGCLVGVGTLEANRPHPGQIG